MRRPRRTSTQGSIVMDFENRKYRICNKWIAERLNEQKTWDEIKNLCVGYDAVEPELEAYQEEGWPDELTVDLWVQLVDYYREKHKQIELVSADPVKGVDKGTLANAFVAMDNEQSSWFHFKNSLTKQMSDRSIANIQTSCQWVLNHLSKDTRKTGPVKGLVTGSVQSGKTANMEGLVSMAADYDWNFFIVLSGTIENLRIQTRDRFVKDLKNSEGTVTWKVLDFSGEDKNFLQSELKLNSTQAPAQYALRYVCVCLKNSGRLTKLLKWLYEDPNRTSKLRLLILDDEADQASVNTAKIVDDPEEQERKRINQLIVNLANGKQYDGSEPKVKMQAINYISFTATPYANVLNESSAVSLYPKDFVCALPEAYEYFGLQVIFGNNEEEHPGLGITRQITPSELSALKKAQSGELADLPESMYKSIAWFLCAAAILRSRGHKKSISMLVHTSATISHHFTVYTKIKAWLSQKDKVLLKCREMYDEEIGMVSKEDLIEANPKYSLIDSVDEDYPSFSELLDEIDGIINELASITLSDEGEFQYSEGLHLCVDNYRANKWGDSEERLRIVYPTDKQLNEMSKAPVFLVIGGNTLSRGLTIDGLLCTYFARTVNQADTLMQMARWFGYRKGFELLQRIWLDYGSLQKFEALAKIDFDMKNEIEDYMERGLSPAALGVRIRNVPDIARFVITSKNKMQRAEYTDFDFSGLSYETTDFENDESLSDNLKSTEQFINMLSSNQKPRVSSFAKAYVWDRVAYGTINSFLDNYCISDFSPLKKNLPIFEQWMTAQNKDGKYLHWNVAVINGDDHSSEWTEIGLPVGCIRRSQKATVETHVDIGSLRSGLDALCDVREDTLTSQQQEDLKKVKLDKKLIISKRCLFDLEDEPLLLIYRIKKGEGNSKAKHRKPLQTNEDVIGISIIISGDKVGNHHAKSLRVKL